MRSSVSFSKAQLPGGAPVQNRGKSMSDAAPASDGSVSLGGVPRQVRQLVRGLLVPGAGKPPARREVAEAAQPPLSPNMAPSAHSQAKSAVAARPPVARAPSASLDSPGLTPAAAPLTPPVVPRLTESAATQALTGFMERYGIRSMTLNRLNHLSHHASARVPPSVARAAAFFLRNPEEMHNLHSSAHSFETQPFKLADPR